MRGIDTTLEINNKDGDIVITVFVVPINLGAKEQFPDAYVAINPRCVVPTLTLDDGTAIGEVLAIWRYLEEAFPTPALMGSTPKDKALVRMWERNAGLELAIPSVISRKR